MSLPETEILNELIAKVFAYESIIHGDTKRGFVVQYHGHLLGDDSATAYDQLVESLAPYKLTPLFQEENGKQVIILVHEVAPPQLPNITINLLFFLATLASVLFTGAVFETELPANADLFAVLEDALFHIWRGIPFAVSLLSILLAHEFGHYLMGRHHNTKVTLPFFLPLPYPFSILGTLGAFIQMKERPKNKRVLFDIGLAGPLAGLAVAMPVLLYGLSLSTLSTLSGSGMLEGNSIIYLFAKFAVLGKFLPEPTSYNGVAPVLYWIRYIFTSTPSPIGALDVQVHNIAWAGWAGLLVTSLNMIPMGTLDGGHILYSVFGKNAKKLAPFILAALFLLGFAWQGWWMWALMLHFLGRRHAEPLDQITELDSTRRKWAIFALIVFILVFIPVPLVVYG